MNGSLKKTMYKTAEDTSGYVNKWQQDWFADYDQDIFKFIDA